jgi:hypothetical protein
LTYIAYYTRRLSGKVTKSGVLGQQKADQKRAMDVTERLRRHIEACRKRDAWARRAIDLLGKGKEKAGLEAAEKAELWDLRAQSLAEPSRGARQTSLAPGGNKRR